MPKVTHVKRARKDNPVCKKGESYYWWKFMVGGRGGPKQFSLTRPKASQLTQSEFLSGVYELNERIEELDATSYEGVSDLQSEADDLASEYRQLGEQCTEKRENMPEGLQDGETGCMLEERADGCEEIASELESMDFELNLEFDPDELDKLTDAQQVEVDERMLELVSEIQTHQYEGQ